MTFGITAIGLHVPRFRMDGSHWASGLGTAGSFGRSVASFDEDAVTMSVAAAEGMPAPDALYFASLSAPYREKSNASIIAGALDWPKTIRTAEFSGTLRAGTQAMLAAWEGLHAGTVGRAVVAAADVRVAQPGSVLESQLGDAAVAVAMGPDPAAEIAAFHTHTEEFLDRWRRDGDRFLQAGEAKYVIDHGWLPHLRTALDGVLARAGLERAQLARVAINAPDVRTRAALPKALGISAACLVDPAPVENLGETGCAGALLELAVALESARPGDWIAVLNAAEGADALLFKVIRPLAVGPVSAASRLRRPSGAPLPSYGHYLRFRNLIEGERLSPFSSLPVLHREEKQNLRLRAAECRRCGAVNYPIRRLCRSCGGREMADRPLGRTGAIFTFTRDHLYPSPLSPVVMVSADLDGGARFYTQMTDLDPARETVAIGERVRLVLRRLHEGEGFHNYFWKFVRLP